MHVELLDNLVRSDGSPALTKLTSTAESSFANWVDRESHCCTTALSNFSGSPPECDSDARNVAMVFGPVMVLSSDKVSVLAGL